MNLGVIADNAFRRFPHHCALNDEIRRVTYAELAERTLRLGTALLKLGLKKGDRIASLQYNSIETIEFDIAAARFGFVRTFLNARAERSNHEHAINDCGAKILLFGPEFADDVAAMRPNLRNVEIYIGVAASGPGALSYEDQIQAAKPLPPSYDVTESDWHSIYYTSGSTGKPKGVVLSQKNWLVLIRNHLTDLFSRASETDVVMHAAPISHGSGAFIWAHLARGARQHVVRRFNAEAVLDTIQSEKVTTAFLAPTMIVKLMEVDGHRPRDKSNLHSVVYGGGPMAVEKISEAMRRWGPVFAQLYGQWEAPQYFTFFSQKQHVTAMEDGASHRLASAGTPVTYARVAVMNDGGDLLPAGAEGEIVTAGDHLMIGYLNKDADTKAIRHGIWQRTGDIGRIDDDGFVYLIDRKNDVIITGGSNVYPREIEEVLYCHPSVHEALAIGVPDDVWGERVHALVVPKQKVEFNTEEFLAWCRNRLGNDKRPRSVEVADELPKSDYGKVLRREIRGRYWQGRLRQI